MRRPWHKQFGLQASCSHRKNLKQHVRLAALDQIKQLCSIPAECVPTLRNGDVNLLACPTPMIDAKCGQTRALHKKLVRMFGLEWRAGGPSIVGDCLWLVHDSTCLHFQAWVLQVFWRIVVSCDHVVESG